MIRKIVGIMSLVIALSGITAQAATQIYVSNDGNDYNDGSFENPYKTIERAKTTVKHLKQSGKYPLDGVEIILRGGRYYAEKTIYFFSDDSGYENAPVTYKAYDNEEVIITTARKLNSNPSNDERLPEASRGKVRAVNVSSMKLFDEDFVVSGENTLFHTAQYPNINDGYLECTAIEAGDIYSVTYSDAESLRIESWTNTDKISLCGYPVYRWEYTKTDILEFDKENKTITSEKTGKYDVIDQEPSFWISNVMEELDEPSEYYFDTDKQILYYYPEEGSESIYISKKDAPAFCLVNTDYISFENIDFHGIKNVAVKAYGCDNLKMTDGKMSCIGENAVNLKDCTNSTIDGFIVNNIGCGGINITGGDRYNLIPSNNKITNCDFTSFALTKHTYSPAIKLSGVGDEVLNSDFHDEFHQAIKLEGNDCVIKNNKFYNLCIGTEDAGAIYAYGDSSCRGNVIESNYFENIGHIKPTSETEYKSLGIWAVYLDGMTSSQTVKNNVFCNIVGGVFCNMGGDITVKDNIYNNVTTPVTMFPATYSMNNKSLLNSYIDNYYAKYYNPDKWSKYKNYDKLTSGAWEKPSYVYNDIYITGNKYYGDLTLYTEQFANIKNPGNSNHLYKAQVVYLWDCDNAFEDDGENTVIVFENNQKQDGEPTIDMNLYGVAK